MGSLSAIPGYTELNSQYQAVKAQTDTLLDQRDAALANGDTAAAQQYQQQAAALADQRTSLNNQLQQLILNSENQDLASPTVTTGQSQSTPQNQASDDSPSARNSQGAGAGTTNNSVTSAGADDNPKVTGITSQQTIKQAFGTSTNSQIVPQPNVLDQFDSYTYSISWYLLSTEQYNNLYSSMKVNTAGWQLLMQSGGIPVPNRNQFFSVDYYMDDLEIDSVVPLHGTNMINSATELRWKVTEPNGITLIDQLYKAVDTVSRNTAPKQNYLTAQHCLVIQFYGYDSQGNLVAPISGSTSGASAKSVIQKYYPCVISDIKFRVANKVVEYSISAKPLVHFYNASTDRGTIPFAFSLSGQTVAQLLVGGTVSVNDIAQFEPGARAEKPNPSSASIAPGVPNPATLPSLVTGQDNPLSTPGGMDFTAGNF